jgi:hypothetical protein
MGLPALIGRHGPGVRLEVVLAAAGRVTGHPKEQQDQADHDDDDADRPENGDSSDEADDEEKGTENDHGELLAGCSRRPGQAAGAFRMVIFLALLTWPAAAG